MELYLVDMDFIIFFFWPKRDSNVNKNKENAIKKQYRVYFQVLQKMQLKPDPMWTLIIQLCFIVMFAMIQVMKLC